MDNKEAVVVRSVSTVAGQQFRNSMDLRPIAASNANHMRILQAGERKIKMAQRIGRLAQQWERLAR